MSNDVDIVISVAGRTEGGRVVKRTLDDVGNAADKATRSTKDLERQLNQTDRAAQLAGRAMGMLAGAFGLRELQRYVDTWSDLNSRVRIAAGGMEQGAAVMQRLSEMARRTYTSLGQTAETYLLNATAMRELGYNTQQTLDYVETINNALVVSGAKGDRAASVMNALSKAMAGGKLSGEELNTVIQTGGRVAQALADSMDIGVNELRKYGKEGKITSDVLANLKNQLEQTRNEAESMPATIGDAFILLRNSLMQTVGVFDQTNELSEGLAQGIIGIADNMDSLAVAITMATAGFVGFKVAANAAAIGAVAVAVYGNAAAFVQLAAGIRNAAGAMALFHAATMINPVVLAVAGLAAGVAYLSTRTTELDHVQQVNAKTLEKARELNDNLAVSSGKNAEALREEREQLFQSTVDRINATKAILREAEAHTALQRAKGGGIYSDVQGNVAQRQEDRIRETLREQSKGLNELLEAMHGTRHAPSINKKKTATEELTEAQRDLNSAIESSYTGIERLEKHIKDMESMRPLAKAEGKAEELAEAIRRANKELEEMKIKIERDGPIARGLEQLANDIDDGIRESFREAFVASDGGFKGMLDSWKAGFKAFLAELAYAAIARPIVLSVIGGIGAGMGLSSGAMGSMLSDLGGSGIGSLISGAGGFSLSDMTSIGGLLNGGLYSHTLGSIGTGLGNVMTGQAWGAYGPFLPSSAQNVLGGAFGNMGYGAIGGLAANLFGLGGQNTLANMALSGVGSLAGGAIGTGMGTILGLAGGPIGAIAGGFLGTALGGLFGGSSPSGYVSGGVTHTGGRFTTGFFGQDESTEQQQSAYRQLQQTTTDGLNAVLDAMGATLASAPLLTFSSSTKRDAGRIRVGVGGVHTLGDSMSALSTQAAFTDAEQAVQYAMMTVLKNAQFSGVDSDMQTMYQRAFGANTTIEGALSDIELIKAVFAEAVSPAENVASAIDQINSQFDAMYDRANILGLPMEKVTEALEGQRNAAIGVVRAMEAGFQSMEAMKATFDSWLYDQSMSSTSSLSPTDKLLQAQGNFGSLLGEIRGGDASKTQELLQAGQQLLQLGQAMYASSVDFTLLEKFVRDSIGGVARELGVPGYATGTMSARAGMAWVGERGPELVRFNGGERVYNADESRAMARNNSANDARFAAMDDNMSAMREDLSRMTKQFSRVANQMIVAGKK